MPVVQEHYSPNCDLKCLFGETHVAYFSMEIGIDENMPTYSGGLGILAGDFLRSASDLKIPIVGITLLYKKGFFKQKIVDRNQIEEEVSWNPKEFMEPLPIRVMVKIENRNVQVEPWLYTLEGSMGKIPLIFLNTDLPENSDYDKTITHKLYANDTYYRLCQEIILGIGGLKVLDALGVSPQRYHMNEGHSAFLVLELLKKTRSSDAEAIKEVRTKCVFTTHTPVPAGHDKFPKSMVLSAIGEMIPENLHREIFTEDALNMTHLGLVFSNYVNGVAKKHGEVSRNMFPGYSIESITNGVHSGFWTSEPFKKLFDKYISGWESDPFSLRYALGIPGTEFWKAHQESKKILTDYINKKYGVSFDPKVFTLGFARRATAYKRPDMLFSDMERLKSIGEKQKLQIIYGGKAHPKDTEGKELIKKIIGKMAEINSSRIKAIYLEDYDIKVAKKLVSGVDVWLNNPLRPMEASGTSGMKAAHNGVPHFSVLDGWWLEGHIENVTGWSIGPHPDLVKDPKPEADIEDLYSKLEYVIMPAYYTNVAHWITLMKHTIAMNASFFNTHRMMQQYVLDAYFR